MEGCSWAIPSILNEFYFKPMKRTSFRRIICSTKYTHIDAANYLLGWNGLLSSGCQSKCTMYMFQKPSAILTQFLMWLNVSFSFSLCLSRNIKVSYTLPVTPSFQKKKKTSLFFFCLTQFTLIWYVTLIFAYKRWIALTSTFHSNP